MEVSHITCGCYSSTSGPAALAHRKERFNSGKSSAVRSSVSLAVLWRHSVLIMQGMTETLWCFSLKIKTLKPQFDGFQIFQASLPLALIAPLLYFLQSCFLFQYAVHVQCSTKPLLLCSIKSFILCKWHCTHWYELDKMLNTHILQMRFLAFCLCPT